MRATRRAGRAGGGKFGTAISLERRGKPGHRGIGTSWIDPFITCVLYQIAALGQLLSSSAGNPHRIVKRFRCKPWWRAAGRLAYGEHAQLGQNRLGPRAGPACRAAGPRATVGQGQGASRPADRTRASQAAAHNEASTTGGPQAAGWAASEAAGGPARALGRRHLGAALRQPGSQLDQLVARAGTARLRATRSRPCRNSARRVGRSAQGVLAPPDLPLEPLGRAGSHASHSAAAHELLARCDQRRRRRTRRRRSSHERRVSSAPRAPPLAASHRGGRRKAAPPTQRFRQWPAASLATTHGCDRRKQQRLARLAASLADRGGGRAAASRQ